MAQQVATATEALATLQALLRCFHLLSCPAVCDQVALQIGLLANAATEVVGKVGDGCGRRGNHRNHRNVDALLLDGLLAILAETPIA